MISLRQNVLMTFDEVAKSLRPLDRMEVLTKGTNASRGTTTFFEAEKIENYEKPEEGGEENGYGEEEHEDGDSMSSEPVEEGFLMFEDREYDEMEAIYVQAYNDVRRDLKQRRRERGFVRHGGKGRGGKGSGGKGRGGRRPFRRDGSTRPRPKKDDGYIKGSEQDLLARTKCWNCMEFGHYSRDCPLKKNPKKQFVMHTGGPTSSLAMVVASSSSSRTRTVMASNDVPMNVQIPRPESLVRAIFAGIQCHGFECLVDTGAEDAVIGSTAAAALEQELQRYGLRVVTRKPPNIPACAGIGGSATLEKMIDVPTCIAGLLGVIRFTVIKDTQGFMTPPLLPVSYLEAVGARCNLDTNMYETRDGHTAPMRRLPSRHRVINMLAFDLQAWQLPDEHLVDGLDPFLLINAPLIDRNKAGSSSPTSKASTKPSPTRSFLGGRVSRSRSRSPFASGFLRELEGIEDVEKEHEKDTTKYESEVTPLQTEHPELSKEASYTPSIAPEEQQAGVQEELEDTPVGPQEEQSESEEMAADPPVEEGGAATCQTSEVTRQTREVEVEDMEAFFEGGDEIPEGAHGEGRPEEGSQEPSQPMITMDQRSPPLPATQEDENAESENPVSESEDSDAGNLHVLHLGGLEQVTARRVTNRIFLVLADGTEEEVMQDQGWRLQLINPRDTNHIRFTQVMLSTLRKTVAWLSSLQGVHTIIDNWHRWPDRHLSEIWHGDTYFFEAREGQPARGAQFAMSVANMLYLMWDPRVIPEEHATHINPGYVRDHTDLPTLPPPGPPIYRYNPDAEDTPSEEEWDPQELNEVEITYYTGGDTGAASREVPAPAEELPQLEDMVPEEEMPENEIPAEASASVATADQQEDQDNAVADNEVEAKVDAPAVAEVFNHVNTHGTVCEFFNIAEDDHDEDTRSHAEGFQEDWFGEQAELQVQSQVKSRTWQIFACSRRMTRTFPMSRSHESFVPGARTLSNAARAFFRKLRVPRHGAQEEYDAEQDLRHAAEGGRGKAKGRTVTFGGSCVVDCTELATFDDGSDAPHQHHEATDGVGLHAAEVDGDGRGQEEPSGHHEEDESQEGQGRLDRSGNWSTNEPVDSAEALGQGTKGLQPSGGVPTLPSESLQPVVGLLDMREPLGEVAAGSIGIVNYNASAGDPNGQEPSNPGWNIPGALAGATVQTGPGQHSVGGESTWTSSECSTGSNILDWSNWLSERAYGRCQRTQYFEGKTADRFESSEQAQACRHHQRDGDSGAGSGGEQLGSGDRDGGCAGQPQSAADAGSPGQRLLVGPDQLGGSIGQSLKKLVPGRSFSSMMILLCLNCSITTEMVGSFGIPISSTSTTASSCGEFVFTNTLHYDTPHKEPFATAYFFEDLGKRVQQSSADLYGLARALPRPTRRFLTQEMRKKPKIMEVYSPPRVNQQAKKYGFQAAGSLDLTTGWDFTKASHRKKALALIRELCPVLVILSPPCTTFSQLRNLSNYKRSPQQVEAEEAEGLQHLEFAVQIAHLQRRAGRGFLFEHPKSATSWHTPSLARLAALPDVFNVSVDLCRFGLKSLSGLPALKPTLLLTNVESFVGNSPTSKMRWSTCPTRPSTWWTSTPGSQVHSRVCECNPTRDQAACPELDKRSTRS